jgi:hypothetical protein
MSLRIFQLPRSAATAKSGVFAIYDPITDKTVQISVQEAIGASRAAMDWSADTTYASGAIVLFAGLTAWQSLVNANTGNKPTENSYWTQLDISPADGISDTNYAEGLFTFHSSKVIYNNTPYYLQVAAPYLSSDIDAEILAGDWATSFEALEDEFTPTGGTFTAKSVSGELVIELTEEATYTIQAVADIVNQNFFINLKNISGGQIIINCVDLIEDSYTININDRENIRLYISGTQYRIS